MICGFVGVLFRMINEKKDTHKPESDQKTGPNRIKFVGGIEYRIFYISLQKKTYFLESSESSPT